MPFEKRSHTLSFDGVRSQPSFKLCVELSDYFDLTQQEQNTALKKMAKAVKNWREVAKKQGLRAEEIKRMENAFVHEAATELIQYA